MNDTVVGPARFEIGEAVFQVTGNLTTVRVEPGFLNGAIDGIFSPAGRLPTTFLFATAGAPGTVSLLRTTKTDGLADDVNGDGDADPGDTIRYTVSIANDGGADALDVVFTDTPDPNAPLEEGSVSAPNGTVVAGNGMGDTSVEVDFGPLAVGTSVSVEFDAIIADPFPGGVGSVSNQGRATSTIQSVPTVTLTDDPDTPTPGDATTTEVTTPLEVCESELLTCEEDLGVCTGDLGTCQSDLATCEDDLQQATLDLIDCQNAPPFEDADGDGEHDDTDACPGTGVGEPVDGDGCSLDQFCARLAVPAVCNNCDWQNDEPLGNAADCRTNAGRCGPR